MTLDQLMAFTVNGDHARQEQVFERLAQSYAKEPYAIRRMLTEGAVRANDKRAQFIGLEVYADAGGAIMRDLFQGDDGGWLQDVALVDRLVAEKLEREAEYDSRRRLEVDRGRAGLRLWPHLWPASAPGRGSPAHSGGGSDARRAPG